MKFDLQHNTNVSENVDSFQATEEFCFITDWKTERKKRNSRAK